MLHTVEPPKWRLNPLGDCSCLEFFCSFFDVLKLCQSYSNWWNYGWYSHPVWATGLWRIMDVSALIRLEEGRSYLGALTGLQQQQVVTMRSLIGRINAGIADHLRSPTHRVCLMLLRSRSRHSMKEARSRSGSITRSWIRMKSPSPQRKFRTISIVEKTNVGLLAHKKKLITID